MLSFPNVLTLIFVVCKLTGVIAWSWWLVFLPTIISGGIGLAVFVLFAAAAAVESKR